MVYDVAQQQLQYLVEFVAATDPPPKATAGGFVGASKVNQQ